MFSEWLICEWLHDSCGCIKLIATHENSIKIMELLAWGANSYGQLGLGYKCEQILIPTLIPFSTEDLHPKNIKSVAAGAGHTIILTKNYLLYSCGWNSKGQLGVESESLIFTQIKFLSKYIIVQVSCGWDFSAAITDNGELFVWGSNAFSQLGLPKTVKHTCVPTLIEHINAKHVSCGLRHMAVVTSEGKVMICGNGNKGQLGLTNVFGNIIRESNFKEVPHIKDIILVSCGQFHTLALKSDGTIFGWGCNKHGQLGLSPEIMTQISSPTKITIILNIIPTSIFTGWTHSVILTKHGDIINFGRNSYGQLGNKRENCWEPKQIPCEKISLFSAGSEHNLAVTIDNKLICWGWNEHGNCGTGDTKDVEHPRQILTNHKIIYAATGTGQSFAVIDKLTQ